MGNGENGENEAESIRGAGEARELMYMGKGSGFLRCLKRPEITDQEKRQIAQNCHGQNYSNLKGSNKGIRIKAQDWGWGKIQSTISCVCCKTEILPDFSLVLSCRDIVWQGFPGGSA